MSASTVVYGRASRMCGSLPSKATKHGTASTLAASAGSSSAAHAFGGELIEASAQYPALIAATLRKLLPEAQL
jgi:hypothetical protein